MLMLVLKVVVVMVVGLWDSGWAVATILTLVTLPSDSLPAVDGGSQADGTAIHFRLVALDHWDNYGKVVLLL